MDLIVEVAPGLLVGVVLTAAGARVFRVGQRKHENVLRIVGLVMLAVGLATVLAVAAFVVLFYLWATSDARWL